MEIQPMLLTVLATAALVLMVIFTGGIAYLTIVDWRDRRRLEREQKNNR